MKKSAKPHGIRFADAIMKIERFGCRRAKPERRPQTKDGQAPVPGVRVFPIMSLLRSELN